MLLRFLRWLPPLQWLLPLLQLARAELAPPARCDCADWR